MWTPTIKDWRLPIIGTSFSCLILASSLTLAPAAASAGNSDIEKSHVEALVVKVLNTHTDISGGFYRDANQKMIINLKAGAASDALSTQLRQIDPNINFRSVGRATDELSALMSGIGSQVQKRSLQGAFGVGISDELNNVVVHSTDVAATKSALSAMPVYAAVAVEAGQPSVATLGRQDDHNPFWGGARVLWSGSRLCSAGFTITNTAGTRYMVTAGHCGGLDATWTNASQNAVEGVVHYRSYGGGGTDSELLGDYGYGSAIYVGGAYSTSYRTVHGSTLACYQCNVYAGGSVSGEHLGRLNGSGSQSYCENISDPFTGGYYYSCNLVRMSQTGQGELCVGGDSGGPVYVYDGVGGVLAIGIITSRYPDGSAAYTQIDPIVSRWSARVTTG